MKERYSKDFLEKLYSKYGSIKNVAKRLNVKYNTLHYYYKEYNIGNYTNRGPKMSKEDLVELHNKYGSITKVAAGLSKSYSTIRSWYKYYGIVVNVSNMTVFHEIRKTPMTSKHVSAVIGSLLGDGCLRLAPHSKNALLEVSHCEKQKQYLEWLNNLLKPFSRPIKQNSKAGKKVLAGRVVNASNFYRFWTIAHSDITAIYKKYYRRGLKGVDESIIDKIDLLAMAIWFADDGNIKRDRKKEPCFAEIATCSFTYDEHLILKKIVNKFFDGKIMIRKHGGYYKGKKREDFVLRMSGKVHIKKFLDMIKTVLPECIHYKLS